MYISLTDLVKSVGNTRRTFLTPNDRIRDILVTRIFVSFMPAETVH